MISPRTGSARITGATVVDNPALCREHHKLVLRVPALPSSVPGQFVHLVEPLSEAPPQLHTWDEGHWPKVDPRWSDDRMTFRRAFSIAGRRGRAPHTDIDVIYRVVGKGTHWMASLRAGDGVDLLGPVGNGFRIPDARTLAILVAGGVGLPPMLYWAEHLADRGVRTVVFSGAQSADFLPLTCTTDAVFDPTGVDAACGVVEFDRIGARVVISTDDGSLGYHGFITDALTAHLDAQRPDPKTTAVYTCGPEPMMRRVAELAESRGLDCQACMERSMACGMGTCQSCVVPIHDASKPQAFRYALCCTDGPVFNTREILWEA